MSTGISAVVLAGGASRRMGTDKRSMAVSGKPMLAIAVDLVAGLSDDVILSCHRDRPPDERAYEARSVRLVFDQRDGGPLAGLESALAAARHDLVLVVPVDMPRLTAATLTSLVEAAKARPEAHGAVFAIDSDLDPFPGAYRRSILPTVAEHLDGGHLRMRDLLRDLDVAAVAAHLDLQSGRAFLNVNTPADLDRAEREL